MLATFPVAKPCHSSWITSHRDSKNREIMTEVNVILNIMLTNHVSIPCAVSCYQFDLVLLGKWDTVSSLYVYSYAYKVSHGQEMSCHKWCTDGLNLMHQGNCVPVPAKTQEPPPISALEQKKIIIIIQICTQNPRVEVRWRMFQDYVSPCINIQNIPGNWCEGIWQRRKWILKTL